MVGILIMMTIKSYGKDGSSRNFTTHLSKFFYNEALPLTPIDRHADM